MLTNHTLLARMLLLARAHSVRASGLFSFDGLVTDAVLASIGIGIALALLKQPVAAPIMALPLVLIHRALAIPHLRTLALRDHKTGLVNARGLESAGNDEIARAKRFHRPLSLLLADVDNLREINNRFGHLAGDAALRAVADAIRSETREFDICARFGGDEFVIVLPETTLEEAAAIQARIQERSVRARPFEAGSGMRLSVSFGLVTAAADENLNDLLNRADAQMYAAKDRIAPSLAAAVASK